MPDLRVSLETSGALDVAAVDARVSRVIDVKTPASNEAARNRIENFAHLSPRDQLKFVICSREDYDWSKAVHARAWLDRALPHSLLAQLHSSFRPPCWRIGFWRIACPCVFNCSSTRSCGAMCPASDVELPARAPSCCCPAVSIRPPCWPCARAENYECYALSVEYGQRHRAELDAARRVAAALGAHEHRVMRVDLAGIGGSALTDARVAVPETPQPGIPVTYVPARNTLFLSLALGWAEVIGANDIFVGVNAVDYSGYPDCRPAFIQEFEKLARIATKAGIEGRALQDSRAADRDDQGGHHPSGLAARRGFQRDRFLLSGRRRRQGLRPVRFLPAARGRLRRGEYSRSHAVPLGTAAASGPNGPLGRAFGGDLAAKFGYDARLQMGR